MRKDDSIPLEMFEATTPLCISWDLQHSMWFLIWLKKIISEKWPLIHLWAPPCLACLYTVFALCSWSQESFYSLVFWDTRCTTLLFLWPSFKLGFHLSLIFQPSVSGLSVPSNPHDFIKQFPRSSEQETLKVVNQDPTFLCFVTRLYSKSLESSLYLQQRRKDGD